MSKVIKRFKADEFTYESGGFKKEYTVTTIDGPAGEYVRAEDYDEICLALKHARLGKDPFVVKLVEQGREEAFKEAKSTAFRQGDMGFD